MHVIRLRGPWEYEPLAGTESAVSPPSGRVHVSDDTALPLPAEFCGRVRFRRRFGLPTNIDTHQRVWLVLAGLDPTGATLNDQPLALRGDTDRIDVTDRLRDRNELTLDLDWPCSSPGDVRLEIES